jgi:hypothetical protein
MNAIGNPIIDESIPQIIRILNQINVNGNNK